MKRRTLSAYALLAGMLVGSTMIGSRPAAAAGELSEAQKKQVEDMIENYILDHPEVLIDSLQKYDQLQRQNAEKDAQQAITANRDQLERDPASPVAGNPKGDVTIVEFFDYRCGYCKRVLPAIQELLKTDTKVRYVFKDFPILGPESVTAAEIAVAVWKVAPDKYFAVHTALMEARGDLSEARILDIVKKAGVDPEAVKAVRQSPMVKEQLARNMELAKQLQISGTPAFIIGGHLVPGAVDLDALRQLVSKVRQG